MRSLRRYVCADCGRVYEGRAPENAVCPECMGRLVSTGLARVRPALPGPQPGLLLVAAPEGADKTRRLRKMVLKAEGSPWAQ